MKKNNEIGINEYLNKIKRSTFFKRKHIFFTPINMGTLITILNLKIYFPNEIIWKIINLLEKDVMLMYLESFIYIMGPEDNLKNGIEVEDFIQMLKKEKGEKFLEEKNKETKLYPVGPGNYSISYVPIPILLPKKTEELKNFIDSWIKKGNIVYFEKGRKEKHEIIFLKNILFEWITSKTIWDEKKDSLLIQSINENFEKEFGNIYIEESSVDFRWHN